MEARIFKIERYSLHNGPGIRTTIFLKGCPLKCLWCSNPESQGSSNEIMYNPDLCLSECNECVKVCPVGALQKDYSEKIALNRDICDVCRRCLEACPTQALSLIGMSMSAEEALSELCKDRQFYETSGGGMTISGGEPLRQPGFVIELLKECKKNKLHTVLDTCGYGQWRDLEDILKYTDLVLYDLKCVDSTKHQQYTGVSNELILNNLANLAKYNASALIIRFPFIPKINDSGEDIDHLLHFLKSISLKRVNILPYHRLGRPKYTMLGRSYQLDDVRLPTREQTDVLKSSMMAKGFVPEIIR